MMGTDEIVKRVRFLLNEAEDDKGVSLLSDDVRSLDESIRVLLPQAVAMVQAGKGMGRRVNVRCMAPEKALIADNGDGGGTVTLPDDFVSIVSLKLECWERECCMMYPVTSLQAAWQDNPYTRAGICRPVCVEGTAADGGRVARLFPFTGGSALERFVYEASFKLSDGLQGYSDGMEDAVAYQCAALVYNMFEKYDAAASFLSHARLLYNGEVINKK